MSSIQWYPGHMAKAKRQVQENLKFVDFVIEAVDSRLPLSSRNPVLDKVIGEKPRIIVLTKADLAENVGDWLQFFSLSGLTVLAVDARDQLSAKRIVKAARSLLADKILRNREKGRVTDLLRAMVVGIPNSGKSTLLNTLAGKRSARTGNTPGVTRAQQWIRSNKTLEVLDTPGILWPKFEDQTVGLKLALTGAIKEDIYPLDEVTIFGLDFFKTHYPARLQAFYKIEAQTLSDFSTPELIELLTRQQGFKEDYDRFYLQFLTAIRNRKLGKFCLDTCPLPLQEVTDGNSH